MRRYQRARRRTLRSCCAQHHDQRLHRFAVFVSEHCTARALDDEASIARGNQDDLFSKTQQAEPEPQVDPLRDELQKVNPDELSPREALELLYRLKKL